MVGSDVVEFEPIKLSPATRAWVLDQVPAGARILHSRRLVGGITSTVTRIRVESRTGRRFDVVLRQWPDPPPGEPAPSIDNEVDVLTALTHTPVPAPELLQACNDVDGHPSVLMTFLSGKIDLRPRDMDGWIRQIAALLPVIHEVRPVGQPHPPSRFIVARGVPPWTRRHRLWGQVARILRQPAPVTTTFIHGDYQHFNLLWTDQRLSGAVDWAWSGTGAPDRDVGHCRLNLAVLYSADIAERFRRAYEAEAGRRVEQWWDVHELACWGPGWRNFIPRQVGGRVAVDVAGMRRRVEDLLELAVR